MGLHAALQWLADLFVDAVAYPMRGEGRRVRFLVGILATLPIVFLPVVDEASYPALATRYFALALVGSIAGGYFLRVVQASVRGEGEPPRFERIRDLVVPGFKAGVLYLFVLAFPLELLGHASVLIEPFVGSAAGDDRVVVAVASVALFVVYPAAVGRLAERERLLDAFEVSKIAPAVHCREYLVGALAVATVFGVSQLGFLVVAGTGTFLPSPITLALLGLNGFYFGVVYNRLIGRVWARTSERLAAVDRDQETNESIVS